MKLLYEKRPREDGKWAFLLWGIDLAASYLAGWLCLHTAGYLYGLPSLAVALAALFVVWRKDHDLTAAGFGKGHFSSDLKIMMGLLVMEYLIGVVIDKMPWDQALARLLYYLFFIALQEEITYTAAIGSFLTALPCSGPVIELIHGGMFVLGHLPFQLQLHGFTAVFALQLAIAFAEHLFSCWLAKKRNNILIPAAIHVAEDFLQVL